MSSCERCGDDGYTEGHHTSYSNDETVRLCSDCHYEVHADEDDSLYPEDIENSPHRGSGIRPQIRNGEEIRPHVREYAKANGLRMPAAYGQLLEIGLDNAPSPENDSNDET